VLAAAAVPTFVTVVVSSFPVPASIFICSPGWNPKKLATLMFVAGVEAPPVAATSEVAAGSVGKL
jgi:hypothetical protein